jgi:hypothetical protein
MDKVALSYPHRRTVLLTVAVFALCLVPTQVRAEFFSVDQLLNKSHARTWNAYLHPKRYINSYYRQWLDRPENQSKDYAELVNEFWQVQVPIPDSALDQDLLIRRDQFVAIFSNSVLKETDRISGLWGRRSAANSHIYIGLEKNGLEDAWNNTYTHLYVIAESESLLAEFKGLDVRPVSEEKVDSLTAEAIAFLSKHEKKFRDTFWAYKRADETRQLPEWPDSVRDLIRRGLTVTVCSCDFTADGVDDFILSAKEKDPEALPVVPFVMVFESGSEGLRFIGSSQFEQVICNTDSYFLLVRTGESGSGIWGWQLFEGKGDGNLKGILSEMGYST